MELLELLAITLTFSVLITSYFTTIGLANYPTDDWDQDYDNGSFEGVGTIVVGRYATGEYYLYQHAGHWGSRWVSWPSYYRSSLFLEFTSDTTYYIVTNEDNYGGPYEDVWCDDVYSYAWCEFTNFLGGRWSRSCSSYVEASP